MRKINKIIFILFSILCLFLISCSNKQKENVELPILSKLTYEFTGSDITPDYPTSDKYTVDGDLVASSVGEYFLDFKLNDASKYQWTGMENETYRIVWEITTKVVSKPSLSMSDFKVEEGSISYIGNKSEDYTFSYTLKEENIYEVNVSLSDPYNTKWDDNTTDDIIFTYNASIVVMTKPSNNQEFTYSGLIVDLGFNNIDGIEIEGTASAKNAGNYKCTIKIIDKTKAVWSDGTYDDFTFSWKINKATFDLSSVEFNDLTIPYDGNSHELVITSTLPEGITAYYNNNKQTQIGVYTVSVFFGNDNNYNTIMDELKATLTIDKGRIDMSSIKFESQEFYFDNNEHEIAYSGTLPTEIISAQYVGNTKLTGVYNKTMTETVSLVFTVNESRYYTPDPIVATITVKPTMLNVKLNNDDPIQVCKYEKYANIVSDLSKPGYIDNGWFKDGVKINMDDQILEDVTLTSDVHPIEYNLKVYTNVSTSSCQEYQVTFDSDYTLPTITYDTNEYEFLGWYYKTLDNKAVKIEQSGKWTYALDVNALYTVFALKNYSSSDSVKIKVVDDKVEIYVNKLASDFTYSFIYPSKISSYYYTDSDCGLSKDKTYASDSVIGVYINGYACKYVFDRIDVDGNDLYYKKYYITNGDAIISGPTYPTEINAVYDVNKVYDTYNIKSKKGLTYQYLNDLADLDVNYSQENFVIYNMIYPNEYTDSEGNLVKIDNETLHPDAYKFVSDGVTYYFRETDIQGYDNYARYCQSNHIKANAILLLWSLGNDMIPDQMLYDGARLSSSSPSFYAFNTSTELGCGYWTAMFRFLAERYSDGEHGYFNTFTISNEIDFPNSWNAIIDPSTELLPSVFDYAEEYYRVLRIAQMAFNEYSNNTTALVPFTHYFAGKFGSDSYHPAEILELFMEKNAKEGNFKWGLASHAYPSNLNGTDAIYSDTKESVWGVYDASKYSKDGYNWLPNLNKAFYFPNMITINNLETYQRYLSQDYCLNPDGSVRDVYLTEVGISTGSTSHNTPSRSNYSSDEEYNNAMIIDYQQSYSLAYAYYKVEMIECIKGYIYYKDIDQTSMEGAGFGLRSDDWSPKLAFFMWKDIDKVNTDTYKSYLNYCQGIFNYPNDDIISVYGMSYLDVIKKVSNHLGNGGIIDWDTEWNKMINRLGIEK